MQGAGGGSSGMNVTDLGASRSPALPEFRHVASIRADIDDPIEIAQPGGPTRVVFPIVGGAILGPNLSGHILPGGSDFAFLLPDGSYRISARYCLRLDDGTAIQITNEGRMFPEPGGDFVGRTRAEFEVPQGPHRWLADHVFIGTALAEADDDHRVFIEIFQAL